MHNLLLTFPSPMASYSICIGEAISEPILKDYLFEQEVCIVLDSQVALYHQSEIAKWIERYPPKRYACFMFASGEQHKNMDTFQELLHFLLKNQFSRALNLVAIGGGVVGDLTGFVAACYLRGVHFIYCPTTLLAQIDAAIGGKTAVNLPEGKNLIGVFYPPKQVVCDSLFLASLPDREFRAGLAEAVKHGMVCSKAYFNWLKENVAAILNREPAALSYLILESIRLKSQIVTQDVEDKGCRQWLNFGHTIGHALESATGYQGYLHGEAVAIGMVLAMKLSEQQLGLSSNRTEELVDLLTKFDLPVRLNNIKVTVDKVLAFIHQDKKKRAGVLNWILLKEVGQPILISGIFEEQVKPILLTLGAR